jgi:hypothetical protein
MAHGISSQPSNGWHHSNVEVGFSGTDTTSGVASSTYRYRINGGAWQPGSNLLITTDGTYTINAEVQDVAGNTGAQNITIRLDKTPPTVNPSASGTQQNGWFRTAVDAAANAADATSGIANIQHRVNDGAWQNGANVTIAADGTHTVAFRATDNAGHVTTHEVTFSVDRTPPGISQAVVPDGQNGWYVSYPVISLAASDTLSGILPGSLRFQVNDSTAWTSGDSVTITKDGTHTIEAQVDDLAGNTSNITFDVWVDTTPPDLDIAVSSASPIQNGWHVEPATARAVASDATSGVGLVEYRLEAAVVSANRAGRFSLVPQSAWMTGDNLTITDGDHLVHIRAIDMAGNQTVTSERIRVDLTPPVSVFDAVSGPISGVIALTGASFDAHSGVDVVEYSFDNGQTWEPVAHINGEWAVPFDTTGTPDGEYTILARAIDRAGHTEISPISLTVIVNNQPPKPLMTESWWIWESGELSIEPGLTPLGEIHLVIACGSQPDVRLGFKNLNQMPSEFTWNRRCGDGYLAPPGDYPVRLTACNIYGKCDTARATIRIPEGQTPTPTPEATKEQETESPTVISPPSLPGPTAPAPETILERVPVEARRVAAQMMPVVARLWHVFVLAGLLLLGFVSLSDPRPRAMRGLADSLGKLKK